MVCTETDFQWEKKLSTQLKTPNLDLKKKKLTKLAFYMTEYKFCLIIKKEIEREREREIELIQSLELDQRRLARQMLGEEETIGDKAKVCGVISA